MKRMIDMTKPGNENRRLVLAGLAFAALAGLLSAALDPRDANAQDAAARQGGGIARENRQRVERLLQDEPQQQLRRGRSVARDQVSDEAPSEDGRRFLIRKITVNEPQFLSRQVVAAIIARYEGRQLTIAEMRRLTSEFDAAYVASAFKAGFAVLPDQDVAAGQLQILLVEPHVYGVALAGLNRVRPDYVAERIPLRAGDPLDLVRLERNLNLMNRTSRSGLQLEALLAPGGTFGTSQLNIATREPPAAELIVGMDNFGTEATGRARPITMLRINNATGRDDPLQFGLTGATDTLSGFFSYSTPIVDFLRFNVSASSGNSQIGGTDLADLGLETESKFITASLENPVFVTDRWMLKAEGGASFEASDTSTGPLLIEQRISEAFAQAHLNYYGDTGGMISSLRYGRFQLRIEDNAGASREWYSYFSGTLYAYKRLEKFEFRLRGEAQWTPDELLPTARQFSLGGPYSVRGYESSEFSGDSGFYLGLEARADLFAAEQPSDRLNALTALVFADGGGAFPYRADGAGVQREDFATSLGTGIELTMFDRRLNLFAGIAMPLDKVHEAIHENQPRFLLSASFTQPL